MRHLVLLFFLACGAVQADETVRVCYNYGCMVEDEVRFSEDRLQSIARSLGEAQSAVQERALLGMAVGRLLGWAGGQTPIAADRGGNYADDGVHGRMDCIDHSTTTTRLLHLLERRGWLRFHRVLEPVRRARLLIFEHYAAQIAEDGEGRECRDGKEGAAPEYGARYVVDSWFFDNGQPAVVMSLENWLAGEGPDIGVAYERE